MNTRNENCTWYKLFAHYSITFVAKNEPSRAVTLICRYRFIANACRAFDSALLNIAVGKKAPAEYFTGNRQTVINP